MINKFGERDISEQIYSRSRNKIIFCVNERPLIGQPSCARRGSRELMQQTEDFIKQGNIDLAIESSVCMGRCAEGPTVKLAPRGEFIANANAENIKVAIIKFTSAD